MPAPFPRALELSKEGSLSFFLIKVQQMEPELELISTIDPSLENEMKCHRSSLSEYYGMLSWLFQIELRSGLITVKADDDNFGCISVQRDESRCCAPK
jgi:hypothetical protein